MENKIKKLRVSSVEAFRPNGTIKSITKYDGDERVAYVNHYDAQGRPLNGVCGDFMTWQMLDQHTIRITGDGDMDDFSASVLPPWHSHEITSVILEEGIRSVGAAAFSNNLTKACVQRVSLPESLYFVADNAFEGSLIGDKILTRYMK